MRCSDCEYYCSIGVPNRFCVGFCPLERDNLLSPDDETDLFPISEENLQKVKQIIKEYELK